jgi:hypothetical protein
MEGFEPSKSASSEPAPCERAQERGRVECCTRPSIHPAQMTRGNLLREPRTPKQYE